MPGVRRALAETVAALQGRTGLGSFSVAAGAGARGPRPVPEPAIWPA